MLALLAASLLPIVCADREIIVTLPPDSPRSKILVGGAHPWKESIVTTVFWVGEQAAQNNPVPNDKSSWDSAWMANFGGVDCPDNRIRGLPSFVPRQNPFYVALPYNDVTKQGTRPEAALVVPWFRTAFVRDGQSVCKGRWVAVRYANRICFAQWEDVGPFRVDHWQYVFGNDRPSPNRNRSAGLDVSPAVRDYLGMGNMAVTDWRFAELWEIPEGPWRLYGDNNIFAVQRAMRGPGNLTAAYGYFFKNSN